MSRNLLRLAAFAGIAAMATVAQARDLTVVSWGGAYQDAQREVYFKPFTAATGIALTEDSWNGGIGAFNLADALDLGGLRLDGGTE